MPIDYSKYPPNWHNEIRPAILTRAKFKCELCGMKDRQRYILLNGKRETISDEFEELWAKRMKCKIKKVVLTIAHLNHDITNNNFQNLMALCQQCHNRHDAEQRKLNRKINANQSAATGVITA